MDDNEVKKILGDEDETKVEPETPEDKETPGEKVYEVNGRKYTAAEVDKMATDFKASEQERGRLAHELDVAKKGKEVPTDDKTVTDDEKVKVKKVWKEDLGFVDEEELDKKLDTREYVREATKETQRLAKEYGLDPDDLFKEMIDLNRRIPVEKLELFLKMTHPDEYEKKRQEAIKADKPETPYTERTTKPGVEVPAAKPVSFRANKGAGNIVDRALELLGTKE